MKLETRKYQCQKTPKKNSKGECSGLRKTVKQRITRKRGATRGRRATGSDDKVRRKETQRNTESESAEVGQRRKLQRVKVSARTKGEW